MKALGKELIFIGRIEGDGNKITSIKDKDMRLFDDDKFKINCLSMTNRTFIASGFNTYVVKFK